MKEEKDYQGDPQTLLHRFNPKQHGSILENKALWAVAGFLLVAAMMVLGVKMF